MIDLWLRLWQLTRPYKGRLVLGIICSVLSGVADTTVLATVAIVAGAAFSGTAPMPKEVPHWVAAIYLSAQEWVATHVASRLVLVALVSLIPLVMLARGLVN